MNDRLAVWEGYIRWSRAQQPVFRGSLRIVALLSVIGLKPPLTVKEQPVGLLPNRAQAASLSIVLERVKLHRLGAGREPSGLGNIPRQAALREVCRARFDPSVSDPIPADSILLQQGRRCPMWPFRRMLGLHRGSASMARKSWKRDLEAMWSAFEKSIKDETLRGKALVHGALIEDATTRLLQAYLVPGPSTSEMFSNFTSAAGTWSNKTNLAFAVGLITEEEARAADLLRAIRNDFAHSMEPEIEDASILDRLNKFTRQVGGDPIMPLLTKYQMLVSYLASSFFSRLNEIGDARDQQPRLTTRQWTNIRPLEDV